MSRGRRRCSRGAPLLLAALGCLRVQATTRVYGDRSTLLSYYPPGEWSAVPNPELFHGSGTYSLEPRASFAFAFAGAPFIFSPTRIRSLMDTSAQQVIVLGSCTRCTVLLDGETSTVSSSSTTLFRQSNLDSSTTHHLTITNSDTRDLILVDEIKVAYLSSSGRTPRIFSSVAAPSSRSTSAHRPWSSHSSWNQNSLPSSRPSTSLFPDSTSKFLKTSETAGPAVSSISASPSPTSSTAVSTSDTYTVDSTATISSSLSTASGKHSAVVRERARAGAIAGSVLGALLVFAILVFCIGRGRRKAAERRTLCARGLDAGRGMAAVADLSSSDWKAYRHDGGNLPVGIPGKHFSRCGIANAEDIGHSPVAPAECPNESCRQRTTESPSWSRLARTRAYYRVSAPAVLGHGIFQLPIEPFFTEPDGSKPRPTKSTLDRVPATPALTAGSTLPGTPSTSFSSHSEIPIVSEEPGWSPSDEPALAAHRARSCGRRRLSQPWPTPPLARPRKMSFAPSASTSAYPTPPSLSYPQSQRPATFHTSASPVGISPDRTPQPSPQHRLSRLATSTLTNTPIPFTLAHLRHRNGSRDSSSPSSRPSGRDFSDQIIAAQAHRQNSPANVRGDILAGELEEAQSEAAVEEYPRRRVIGSAPVRASRVWLADEAFPIFSTGRDAYRHYHP